MVLNMLWLGGGYKLYAAGNGDSSTELISQMLIDDSNWFTHSASSMQKCVDLHES